MPRAIASSLEVAQVDALHAVRAMQRGVSRQDAFLIPFANFADGLVWTAAWVGAAARSSKRLRSTSAAASGQTLRGSAAEDIALR